jgi:hypothetical protein
VAVTSITFFASATSTAATINFPASIIAGDLIVLYDHALGGATPVASVTPSGFTVLTDLAAASLTRRHMVSYKLATGSESGALTGMNGASSNRKVMLVFRGDVAAQVLNVSVPNEEYTDNNPTPQVVDADAGTPPLVVLACFGGSTAIVGETFTPAEDGEVTSADLSIVQYKIYDSAPADTTVDMADEGTGNFMQSFYVEMATLGTDYTEDLDVANYTLTVNALTFDFNFAFDVADYAYTAQAIGADFSLPLDASPAFTLTVNPITFDIAAGLDVSDYAYTPHDLAVDLSFVLDGIDYTVVGGTLALEFCHFVWIPPSEVAPGAWVPEAMGGEAWTAQSNAASVWSGPGGASVLWDNEAPLPGTWVPDGDTCSEEEL